MKKALIFAGSDAHGMTMGIISQRNLTGAGYNAELFCESSFRYPSKFWGEIFIGWDFSGVDMVVTTDIPLPHQDGTFPNAIPDAMGKIRELVLHGVKVVIIDHHSSSDSYYGLATEDGAEVIITTSASTCYWGDPTDFSEFWGRIGAIADRDSATLPIREGELRLANSMDYFLREHGALEQSIAAIQADNRDFFNGKGSIPKPDGEVQVIGNCLIVSQTTPQWGFKQLDHLLSEMPKGTRPEYAVSVDRSRGQWRVLAITHWQCNALPIGLLLGLSSFIGHPSAIVLNIAKDDDPQGFEKANQRALEIVDQINGVVAVGLVDNHDEKENLFAFVSNFMRKVSIPFFLTQHGWPHVERVVANCRSLSSVFNLTERETRLLDFVALFHDVGNGAAGYYPELGLNDSEARKRHHEFSAQMIREWAGEGLFKGVLTNEEVEIVAELSLRHRKKMDLPTDKRLSELCRIFRVADGMDIDARRAQTNDAGLYYEDIDDLPADSKEHWEGHRAIEALRIISTAKELTFELVVTDSTKAAFQVAEVTGELAPLTGFRNWNLRVVQKTN